MPETFARTVTEIDGLVSLTIAVVAATFPSW